MLLYFVVVGVQL